MSVPPIRFRPLAESDLPTLVEWFAEPEIARWWNQPAEIDSVRAKYLPRIEQREPTRMWIAEINDKDGGLLQSYLHADYPEHDAQRRRHSDYACRYRAVSRLSAAAGSLCP